MSDEPTTPPISAQRQRGLDKMAEVYGWEVNDGPGDFYGMTVEHLFGEVWQSDALSTRDRRLLLIGTLVGSGQEDVLDIQTAPPDRADGRPRRGLAPRCPPQPTGRDDHRPSPQAASEAAGRTGVGQASANVDSGSTQTYSGLPLRSSSAMASVK